MTITLDTSVALEILLRRKDSNHFSSLLQKSSKVNTSTLYQGELTNVLWKYVKSGFLSKEVAGTLILLGLNLIDEFYPMDDFSLEALNESVRLDHSSYDMFYLTLARRTGSTLLTLDKKLKELAMLEGLEVN